jgi:hypothetical protein
MGDPLLMTIIARSRNISDYALIVKSFLNAYERNYFPRRSACISRTDLMGVPQNALSLFPDTVYSVPAEEDLPQGLRKQRYIFPPAREAHEPHAPDFPF